MDSPRTRLVAYSLSSIITAYCAAIVNAGDSSPLRWDARAAAKYLDERAEWWLSWSSSARGGGTSCIACHTGLPFALVRPALSPALGEAAASALERRVIDGVQKRVTNWDGITLENGLKAFYSGDRRPSALGTEAVLNALILVNHDARWNSGKLSEHTNKSLDRMWDSQRDNGSWLWLNFGLKPWETGDEYFSASLAAITTGMAGKDYHKSDQVEGKITKLRQFLKDGFADQPLHNRIMALWASTELKGLLTLEDQKKLIDEVFDAQIGDGGWNLADLGAKGPGREKWKSQGEYPPGAKADGYATGLIVYVVRRSGVPTTDANLQAGRRWLFKNQDRNAGTWPAVYLNQNRDPSSPQGKFMRDAATAYAVLALTTDK